MMTAPKGGVSDTIPAPRPLASASGPAAQRAVFPAAATRFGPPLRFGRRFAARFPAASGAATNRVG